MLVATKDRPLATTTPGSLPRPGWFTASLHGRPFSVGMADRIFREQYLDTQADYIIDQTRAGLDVLVDGDGCFDDDVAGRLRFAHLSERINGHGAHPSSGHSRTSRPMLPAG